MTLQLIDRAKEKLNTLIASGAPYSEVLRVSQELDKLIVVEQRARLLKGAKICF